MAGQDKLWHVALTVAGTPHDDDVVHAAMLRLRDEHAFLHSLRYAEDRAEICYWEQAAEMLDAAAMAMRVWSEHRDSAGLPPWDVVGLEVLDQATYEHRSRDDAMASRGVGSVMPTPVHF
ncbi:MULTISPECIES: hypothetical protein [Mumia]|uniref:Uncharacterized protein n=1 Tax=Mumia xiangluensis TaxID=1678900 RepID=A0ABW1QUH8_9ACTN|nr:MULTISPECIES: hypothetical protein [Mumia]